MAKKVSSKEDSMHDDQEEEDSTHDDEDGVCNEQEASADGSGNTTTALATAHTALTAAHIATGILPLIMYLYNNKIK